MRRCEEGDSLAARIVALNLRESVVGKLARGHAPPPVGRLFRYHFPGAGKLWNLTASAPALAARSTRANALSMTAEMRDAGFGDYVAARSVTNRHAGDFEARIEGDHFSGRAKITEQLATVISN